ncbi:hypothetical protein GAY33_34910 [Azospirillum brasilense]|uniref:Uncharacterized protein n=1 Tax=Azospirillum brasilense TaxID=192 RepID=A0A4D8Q8X6_AZOBR|nr:hypothetical protein [Azospirillum argentinense]QCO06618.1 hypothetical protein D3867_32350 [Azospirillum argentinense]
MERRRGVGPPKMDKRINCRVRKKPRLFGCALRITALRRRGQKRTPKGMRAQNPGAIGVCRRG